MRLEDLRALVDLQPVGCWRWKGSFNNYGYGIFYLYRRTLLAHRAMYFLAAGGIPDDIDVLHRCDHPWCVRPDHMFLGDQADNNRDRWEKFWAARRRRRSSVRSIRSILTGRPWPKKATA